MLIQKHKTAEQRHAHNGQGHGDFSIYYLYCLSTICESQLTLPICDGGRSVTKLDKKMVSKAEKKQR